MINKNTFQNLKEDYTETQKEIFKRNKWTSKEIYLREEALKDRERILKAWEKFKNTFNNDKDILSLTEQFLFSFVLNRSGLLEKGNDLKEVLKNEI